MTSPPAISLVTVCRNSAPSLGDTLRSVLAQTWRDLEYIVVDGASTDGTPELLRRFEPRFGGRMRWLSEPDAGIYDAMNKGLSLAAGRVVGFLNADDYYQGPEVLARIAAAFAAHPEADAVHADLDFIDARGRVVRSWTGSPYRPGAFQRGWMPAHPTFYCKASCFVRFGAFDPAIGSAADFELMLRFIEKHRIATRYLPLRAVFMRLGGSSTSSLRAVLRNTRQNRAAFRKNGLPCPWHYALSRFRSKISQIAQVGAARRGERTSLDTEKL